MVVKAREEVRGVLPALLLHGLQWLLAYLALDLLFRRIDVRPVRLARSRVRCRWVYGLLAGLATLLIGAVQTLLAGQASFILAAAIACLGWVPWWLLWRFGWRKQFPHLHQAPPHGHE